MAHPYESVRNDKVERSRVGKMFGPECRIERACGGEVKKRGHGGAMRYAEEDPGGDKQGKQAAKYVSDAKKEGLKGGGMAGKKPKHRLDRKRRARGGRAAHSDEAEDRALINKMVKPEARARASGGRAKKGSGKTEIHINVEQPRGDLGGTPPGMMAKPMPSAAPPPMPPPGAGGPPPGGPPMGAGPPPGGPGGGLPPGMMPPRAKGGRVQEGFHGLPVSRDKATRPGFRDKPVKAPPRIKTGSSAAQRGTLGEGPGDGRPKASAGWKESEENKTPVQHTDGKKDGAVLTGTNIRRTSGHGKKSYDEYAGFRQ